MGDNISKIISKAIEITWENFKDNPYDFTGNEIDAQVRLYNTITSLVKDTMIVNRNEPKPSFKNMRTSVVRMEDKLKEGFKPDILIYKENQEFPTNPQLDNLRAFIEIKIGWKCGKSNFVSSKDNCDSEGFLKDVKHLIDYPEKAYIVYYMGDERKYVDNGFKEGFKAAMNQYKQNRINYNNIFIVFRDVIVNGEELKMIVEK